MSAHVLPKCSLKGVRKDAGNPETFLQAYWCALPGQWPILTSCYCSTCARSGLIRQIWKKVRCVRASVVSPTANVELSRGLSGKWHSDKHASLGLIICLFPLFLYKSFFFYIINISAFMSSFSLPCTHPSSYFLFLHGLFWSPFYCHWHQSHSLKSL